MSFPSTVTPEAMRVTPAVPALTSASELRVDPSAPCANVNPLVP